MERESKRIVLGSAQFGMDYGISNPRGRIPYSEAVEILKLAQDSGIDTIDTAYAYGESEKMLGKIMNENDLNFKIISKLPANATSDDVNIYFHESLERIGQRKLYAYLIHDFEAFRKEKKIWWALQKLKEQGKIEKIGFSLYYPSELHYLFGNGINFDIVQIPYSILDQRFATSFSELKQRKIEIYVRSVFLQGLFFKKPEELNDHFVKIKDKLRVIHEIAQSLKTPISSICLEFVLGNAYIDKIIIGVHSIENLRENLINLSNNSLNSEYFDLLRRMKIDDENIILPFKWEV